MASGAREQELYRGVGVNDYEAGAEDLTDDFLAEDVTFSKPLGTLLIYADVDSLVKCNGSTDEIFCPAETWLPLGMMVSSFNIKAAGATITGKAYFHGWY